jgi:hypothetical protein
MTPMFNSAPESGPSLAKLAAFFAATFIVSLGICGYSTRTSEEFGGTPGFFSLIGMLISSVCLLAIGVTALIRSVRDRNE